MKIDLILPVDLQGLAYDDVKSSKGIGQFFDLANMILISSKAMQAHLDALDMRGVTKDNPLKTHLPSVDLDHLRLRGSDGNLLPDRMREAFSIVVAYWDAKGRLGTKAGLVASLWRRGMGAADIIRCIQASTGKDGQLIKATGRGHDIMHTVVDAYLASKGLPADAEIPQTEMGNLVERWLTATRSAPLKSVDAANSVLHWAEYRRLGLIDQSGAAQVELVRRVATHIFTQNVITFDELAAWVDQNLKIQNIWPAQESNPARAMLKKKRKQGKLNRKRGRR